MITVHLSRPPITATNDRKPCVMALGYFDGVHLGHRKVISTAKEIAQQAHAELAVMTFSPHPKEVLGKGKDKVNYLMPLSQKEKMLSELGVDKLYVVEFNEAFAALAPETFVSEFLIGFHTLHAVVGFDFHYGSQGKGNTHTLKTHGKGTYGVTVVPEVHYQGQKISSTLIRSLLKRGDVQQVAPLLGDFYETRGELDMNFASLGLPQLEAAFIPQPHYTLPIPGRYQIQIKNDERIIHGTARVELLQWNQTKVYLEMSGPIDKRWSKQLIDIKWIKHLPIVEEARSHAYVEANQS